MPIEHTVRSGDCISSIAFENGFFPATIWNHASNQSLKSKRADPNVLLPGDKVVVPDLEKKELSKPDAKRHRFKRKGVPDVLRLQVRDENDKPLAHRSYTLEIDGAAREGTTDGEGRIEEPLPPAARHGRLTLADWPTVYELELGHMAPWDSVEGARMRLGNLGFECGGPGGEADEQTAAAVRRFQGEYDLTVNGELNDATKKKLKDVHGC
jgi:peptidoglycan hydrolase-like protein with peptidoglycan-binding domain